MIVYRRVSMFLPHMFGSIELGADPVWGLSHNYLLEFWRHHSSYPFDRIPFLEHMHHHFFSFPKCNRYPNHGKLSSWGDKITVNNFAFSLPRFESTVCVQDYSCSHATPFQ
jgi:hypothetical protein